MYFAFIFVDCVDEQLRQFAKVDACQEPDKYISILMDEMHVKSNLVYNKHSGQYCFIILYMHVLYSIQ
jgi:hypothetical protein